LFVFFFSILISVIILTNSSMLRTFRWWMEPSYFSPWIRE